LVHRTAATPFHIISSSLFINHQDAWRRIVLSYWQRL
jgi:hypothetical protein